MRQLILFCISGTLGFIVDTAVYYLAALVLPYWASRAVSFVCAVISTWLFNRSITFRGLKFNGGILKEFISYFSSMLVGGTLNYFAFILAMQIQLVSDFPILGIAIGSVAGLFANFVLSKFIIFKEKA